MKFEDYDNLVIKSGGRSWPVQHAWISPSKGEFQHVGYIKNGKWHTSSTDEAMHESEGRWYYTQSGSGMYPIWFTPSESVDPHQFRVSAQAAQTSTPAPSQSPSGKRGWAWQRKSPPVVRQPMAAPMPEDMTGRRDPRAAAASRVIDSARRGYDTRITNLRRELERAKSANRADAMRDLEAQVARLTAESEAAKAAQSALGLGTPEAQALQAQIILLAQQNPSSIPSIFAQLVPQAPWGSVAPWNVAPMPSGQPALLAPNMNPMWQPPPGGAQMQPYMDQWGGGAPMSPYQDDWGSGGDPGADWDSLVAMSFGGVSGAASLTEIDETIQAAGAAEDLELLSRYGMNYDIPADVDVQAAACETGSCPMW